MAFNKAAMKARTKFRESLPLSKFLPIPKVFCAACEKYVGADSPWRCAYCDAENREPGNNSYLNRCAKCHKAPEAFVCPHCGEPNSFRPDGRAARPATFPRPPKADTGTEDLRRSLEAARKLEIEELSHTAEVKRLRGIISEEKRPASEEDGIADRLGRKMRMFQARQDAIARIEAECRAKYRGQQLRNALRYLELLRAEGDSDDD